MRFKIKKYLSHFTAIVKKKLFYMKMKAFVDDIAYIVSSYKSRLDIVNAQISANMVERNHIKAKLKFLRDMKNEFIRELQ